MIVARRTNSPRFQPWSWSARFNNYHGYPIAFGRTRRQAIRRLKKLS